MRRAQGGVAKEVRQNYFDLQGDPATLKLLARGLDEGGEGDRHRADAKLDARPAPGQIDLINGGNTHAGSG